MTRAYRRALDDRAALIQTRAEVCADAALAANEPWVRRLGWPPRDPMKQKRWRAAVATVAAYRDRYQISTALALGPSPRSDAQRADRDQAAQSLSQAAAQSRVGDSPAGQLSLATGLSTCPAAGREALVHRPPSSLAMSIA